MRTTTNIEDELADQLRNIAHSRRCSLTEAINGVIREGLRRQTAAKRFVTVPWASDFAPGVDPARLNQLADELEDELIVGKAKAVRQS
jgi:hypothetical protein